MLLTYLTSMSLLRLPRDSGILGTLLTLTRWAATALVPPLTGVITWLLRGGIAQAGLGSALRWA